MAQSLGMLWDRYKYPHQFTYSMQWLMRASVALTCIAFFQASFVNCYFDELIKDVCTLHNRSTVNWIVLLNQIFECQQMLQYGSTLRNLICGNLKTMELEILDLANKCTPINNNNNLGNSDKDYDW